MRDGEEQSVGVAVLEAGPAEEIGTDHLQAIAPRFVSPQHQRGCLYGLLHHRQLALVELELDDLPGLGLLAGQVAVDLAQMFSASPPCPRPFDRLPLFSALAKRTWDGRLCTVLCFLFFEGILVTTGVEGDQIWFGIVSHAASRSDAVYFRFGWQPG